MKNNILNKKVRLNKKLVSLIIFFSILILSHLLISSLRFVYKEYNYFFNTKNSTKNYLLEYENELKKEVFDKLFIESEKCNQLNNFDLKKTCFQKISYTLALIIKEEEFPYWPNDIFFVKKTNNNFFKLGWDGESKTLPTLSNIKALDNKESIFSDFLLRKCDYFGAANIPARSCEVYEKIQLNNNEEGYVVRNIGLTEDDDFIFYLIIPYLAIYGFITSFPYLIFSIPSNIDIFIIEMGVGLVPILIGFVVVRLFNKNSKKNDKVT